MVSKWHLERAQMALMPIGPHKGMRLALVPLNSLKAFSKNWIHKDLRQAALIVLESRKDEQVEKKKPSFQLFNESTHDRKPVPHDFLSMAKPDLQKLFDETPKDWF